MMAMYVAVFLLGVIAGAVGIMIVSCVWVDSMRNKRELTKEEWKMGLHPDDVGSGAVPAVYVVAFMVTLGLLLYVVIGNR